MGKFYGCDFQNPTHTPKTNLDPFRLHDYLSGVSVGPIMYKLPSIAYYFLEFFSFQVYINNHIL